MTKDEALKLALEALERCVATCFDPYAHDQVMSWPEHFVNQTITAIKEALAQREQEPVAWVSSKELLVMRGNALGGAKDWRINVGLVKQNGDVGLYTIPPQRTWVGIDDEEIRQTDHRMVEGAYHHSFKQGVRWAEAKLKEKNA